MRTMLLVLAQVAGVLSGPDPAQMEKAPDLGYKPVAANLVLPDGMKMGAPSSVALDKSGHLLVFNRGEHPLMEFDAQGKFVRAFGEGQYVRPHGMRLDPEGNILGFLIAGKTPGQFSVRRTENFDVSDATLLPSGDMLLLERKFSWIGGVAIRIRRIPLKSFAPGAVVDGPPIFSADLSHEIDNMEGIDAHVTAAGETVITMISDDNFLMIQRNLLLQFTLVE